MSAVVCAPQWTAIWSSSAARQEELGHALALLDVEEHSLACRPEREQAVDSVLREELDVGLERILVEHGAAARERCQGSGNGSAEHGPTVSRGP